MSNSARTEQQVTGPRQKRVPLVFRTTVYIGLVLLGLLPYIPGLSGPYVFDDYSNLLENVYVRVNSLDLNKLKQAAFSISPGPLDRPVAMLSFAMNHYFASGFGNSLPFKLTNLVIHGINGLLVFWLLRLILDRPPSLNVRAPSALPRTPGIDRDWLAAILALLWTVHPIQLTSVLYVVQRMTSLSALFMLLALIGFTKGRLALATGYRGTGIALLIASLVIGWPLALFSKESAVLFPFFVLLLEWYLFCGQWPWQHWGTLPIGRRRALIAAGIVVIALGTVLAVYVALPGYAGRTFTLTERLLTESRVLFFYISLIVAPRLNEFGLLHDDIPISTSLWTPWTTMPSLAGLLALSALAFVLRKRLPLVSFGVLWFLAGHLLESTIFPLEISHEHRNYLASLGILLACAGILVSVSTKLASPWPRWLLPLFASVFAAITYMRATHWSNATSLFYYEAVHHPHSPGATAGLANLLLVQDQYDKSVQAMRTASRLAPAEPAFLISLQTVAAVRNQPLDPVDSQEILMRLATQPVTAVTKWSLSRASDCLLDNCKMLQKPMETWMRLLLDRHPQKADSSTYYYFLGRAYLGQGKVNEAIDAYRQSYELDPYYYHPLFDLATVYVSIGRPDLAKVIFGQIEMANTRNPHKRDADIQRLKDLIDSTRLGPMEHSR